MYFGVRPARSTLSGVGASPPAPPLQIGVRRFQQTGTSLRWVQLLTHVQQQRGEEAAVVRIEFRDQADCLPRFALFTGQYVLRSTSQRPCLPHPAYLAGWQTAGSGVASGCCRKAPIAGCAPATGCSRVTISLNSRNAFIARNGVRAKTSSGLWFRIFVVTLGGGAGYRRRSRGRKPSSEACLLGCT